jgi:hypothetical protein
VAPAIVHRVIRSAGAPLDRSIAESYGRRMGHDFSQVRVHTDEQAAESARSVDAAAYTVGNHIVLGTRPSEALLAHELVHVRQWGDRPIPDRLTVGPAGGPAEREARGPSARGRESTAALQRAAFVCDEYRTRPSGSAHPGPGITVSYTGPAVTVDAQLQMVGGEADAAKATTAQQAINSNWNGTFRDGYSIKTQAKVAHPGAPAPGGTDVELVRSGGHASYTRGHWLVGSDFVTLNLDNPQALTWAIAHEFGHLLGLGDRYSEGIVSMIKGAFGGQRTATQDPGYVGNIMAVYGGRLESKNVRDLISRHARVDCVRGHLESPL